jgi:hypothetical protein
MVHVGTKILIHDVNALQRKSITLKKLLFVYFHFNRLYVYGGFFQCLEEELLSCFSRSISLSFSPSYFTFFLAIWYRRFVLAMDTQDRRTDDPRLIYRCLERH